MRGTEYGSRHSSRSGLSIKMEPDEKSVIQKLENYADEVQDKALNSGLTGAAKIVNDELKKRTPRQPGGGALYKSIGKAKLSKRGKSALGIPLGTQAVLAGPIRKVVDPKYYLNPGQKIYQGFKALWLEFGTGPHEIPSEDKQNFGKKVAYGLGATPGMTNAYRGEGLGGVFSSVPHPGFLGTRFLSRSYGVAERKLESGFYKALAKRLEKLDHV